MTDVLRERAARGELRPALAQIGEAQDGIDEIVFGRELERVDPGLTEGCAEFALAARGGFRETLSKRAVVRIDEELLARFRILDDEHAHIGQLHLEWIV